MSDDSAAKNKRNVEVGGNVSNSPLLTGDKNNVIINQAVAVTIAALHQLPPSPSDFIGRKKEIAELLKAVEKKGVNISGLQGMGGIGKTALALKLAEHLKPQYPDAQFYFDLKGASKQPLSAAEAMAYVIHSYYPEATLPEDENRLRGLYLSLLENKKALLLMDDAATASQIQPLIPPKSCLLLVTSRNRLIIEGLFAKNLDTLEPKDAEKLLLKIAPRSSNCAEKIAEMCGYLPLALRLAAGALQKLVLLTPEEYLQRLQDEKETLGLVEASLSLSYDLLTEELQKFWRMLAIFPNTFDTAAATALWELDNKQAQNHLAELISYSLIEWNDTTRRYRLHDLLKLLAHNQSQEEERYAVGKRHAMYYWQVLGRAGSLYSQGGDQVIQGLSLFDLERENIESGQNWAAANMEAEEVTQLSMVYYNAAYLLLGLRLHPREGIRWLENSLKAARKLDNKAYQGYSLGNLGNAYFHLGETRKAIEFYEQRLEIVREIGDRQSEGQALGNLGIAYWYLGETRKAIEFFEQDLEITREIGDQRGEGMTLGNLGIAYSNLGETRKAIDYHEKSLEIIREIGDRQSESIVLWNSALDYNELGDQALAISLAEMALAIFEQIEEPAVSMARATLDKWKAESGE